MTRETKLFRVEAKSKNVDANGILNKNLQHKEKPFFDVLLGFGSKWGLKTESGMQ